MVKQRKSPTISQLLRCWQSAVQHEQCAFLKAFEDIAGSVDQAKGTVRHEDIEYLGALVTN